MEKYNYLDNEIADVLEYINDRYSKAEIREKLEDRDEWEQELNDDLFVEDSVTGNASGSYTFNTWEAEENVCHNMDLLAEAMEEFGCKPGDMAKGAEWCDVTIRCYLLNQAISAALDELE